MSDTKRKNLNQKHPDCAEYTSKFNALWNAARIAEAAEKAKYPNWTGRDHPATAKIVEIHRRYNAEIKKLQREYSHIFE